MRTAIITLTLSTVATLVACTDEKDLGSRSPDGGASSLPNEASYVQACQARTNRCGDAGPARPDDCAGDYRCYVQAFEEATVTEVLDCLSSRVCGEGNINACLTPLSQRIGDMTFARNCDDRVDECGLSDDYCQEEATLFRPEIRSAFEACLAKDCSAIAACLDAALPACHF